MAKKEILTDLWVYELLKEANIDLHPQGSNIKDIDNALKSASKAGTGNVGFPDFKDSIKLSLNSVLILFEMYPAAFKAPIVLIVVFIVSINSFFSI
jgi:hypothetical protein